MEHLAPPRAHWSESHTQKRRSRRPNCGRFERRSTTSCCLSARFSSARSVRVLSDARSAPNSEYEGHCLPGSHPAGSSSSLATGFWQTTGADVPTSLRDFSGNLDRLAEVVAKETSALQEHAPATASTAHAFAPRVVSHWPRGFQTQARGNPRCSVPIACQR